MKFLVVGCGSVGARHIKNLVSLGAGEVIACDASTARLQSVVQECGISGHADFSRALEQESGLTAVLVCTPSRLHVPMALAAARRGLHLFIEKPLSDTLQDVDELAATARDRGIVATVGFSMRFNPTIRRLKDLLDSGSIGRVLSARASWGYYLPYWHPGEDYRKGYTANKSLGGGIILDCVHELDYLRWFMGEISQVSAFADKAGSLEMDTENLAEILLKFESGVIAGVHLDCLQRTYRRSCELIGEEGVITADLIEQNIRLFHDRERQWKTLYDAGAGVDYNSRSEVNQMYVEEMKHFIECIHGRAAPLVDLDTGARVLQVALAAKESAASGRAIMLGTPGGKSP